jgi:hypothetical protein
MYIEPNVPAMSLSVRGRSPLHASSARALSAASALSTECTACQQARVSLRVADLATAVLTFTRQSVFQGCSCTWPENASGHRCALLTSSLTTRYALPHAARLLHSFAPHCLATATCSVCVQGAKLAATARRAEQKAARALHTDPAIDASTGTARLRGTERLAGIVQA